MVFTMLVAAWTSACVYVIRFSPESVIVKHIIANLILSSLET